MSLFHFILHFKNYLRFFPFVLYIDCLTNMKEIILYFFWLVPDNEDPKYIRGSVDVTVPLWRLNYITFLTSVWSEESQYKFAELIQDLGGRNLHDPLRFSYSFQCIKEHFWRLMSRLICTPDLSILFLWFEVYKYISLFLLDSSTGK